MHFKMADWHKNIVTFYFTMTNNELAIRTIKRSPANRYLKLIVLVSIGLSSSSRLKTVFNWSEYFTSEIDMDDVMDMYYVRAM